MATVKDVLLLIVNDSASFEAPLPTSLVHAHYRRAMESLLLQICRENGIDRESALRGDSFIPYLDRELSKKAQRQWDSVCVFRDSHHSTN